MFLQLIIVLSLEICTIAGDQDTTESLLLLLFVSAHIGLVVPTTPQLPFCS